MATNRTARIALENVNHPGSRKLVDAARYNAMKRGATAGWWTKAVQLDLEAKGLVVRDKSKPLRLRKTGRTTVPKTVDQYIAGFPPAVQSILAKIRQTVKSVAPDAEETISYRIPAFRLNGMLVYFAAFQKHIGLYPPVRGDERLMRAVNRYAGPNGNLQFPMEKPIPYALIRRIVKARVLATRKKAEFGG